MWLIGPYVACREYVPSMQGVRAFQLLSDAGCSPTYQTIQKPFSFCASTAPSFSSFLFSLHKSYHPGEEENRLGDSCCVGRGLERGFYQRSKHRRRVVLPGKTKCLVMRRGAFLRIGKLAEVFRSREALDRSFWVSEGDRKSIRQSVRSDHCSGYRLRCHVCMTVIREAKCLRIYICRHGRDFAWPME